MNNNVHTESEFELAITSYLTNNGWEAGYSGDFSKDLAFNKSAVLDFVKRSQADRWVKLQQYYKADTDTKFIQRLFKELDLRGTLDVLRHGFTDSGIKFRLAYFRPNHSLNPDTLTQYAHNRLTVTRQLFFSGKSHKSLDLLLSLNGLPVATIELKNHLTGQTVADAQEQYRTDRDPRELLFQFKKRAIVHFTLDPDSVLLTTKLDGVNTRFLPFNRGNRGGAGNPPNGYGYRTAYFWEEILEWDSWLEIIGRFLHLQKDKIKDKVTGKEYVRETMIFPRYHQLDAVRKLAADVWINGAGQTYLIQHSAGSGKSNTIAWLAYRLSSLYRDNEKVFRSVIVITDRTVLDQQLQNTIYQFEHKTGVVERVDQDSEQLATAIKNGVNIIITTLQKFPFALRHLKDDSVAGNYAVVIDEAHSSQNGKTSKKINEVLAGQNVSLSEAARLEGQIEAEEAVEESEDEALIRRVIEQQGPQPHISLFAFTATPKPSTITKFGTPDAEGQPRPFHVYSMRQAIEERFILDVLKNYVTYATYYQFSKKIQEDPELNKRKAAKAIGRFASLHPTNLSQRTEVMVEHFRQVTMKKIGGKAKAMVVTASRKHALRYYLSFREYIQQHNYDTIRALVAFSGKVIDDAYPEGVTEPELNGFGEKELPGMFDTDDYQVLLVADKYQTGFDQPLLHTMFVDKKLSGVKAVQTLSRLNRTYPGKDDTFVLDFANDREIILEAFQQYFEETYLTEPEDPNRLYLLKSEMDAVQVYHQSEVDSFSRVFYQPTHTVKDQGRLNAFLDPAVDRFDALDTKGQDDFKNLTTSFVRAYALLSQIMPFQDIDLEKLYSFSRFLLTKLPQTDAGSQFQLGDEIALDYYRLQKVAEGDLILQVRGDYGLDPTTDAGLRRAEEEKARLSDIIRILNDRFGTDFTDADRLYFDQMAEFFMQDENLARRAKSNPLENFKYAVDDVFFDKLIERMDANQDIFDKVMENVEFRNEFKTWLTNKIHKQFNNSES